jgi:hypothetical protein
VDEQDRRAGAGLLVVDAGALGLGVGHGISSGFWRDLARSACETP